MGGGLEDGAEGSLTQKVKYILGRRAGIKGRRAGIKKSSKYQGGGLESKSQVNIREEGWNQGRRAGIQGGGLESKSQVNIRAEGWNQERRAGIKKSSK